METELDKIKQIVNTCLSERKFLKVVIIPYKKEWHVLTNGTRNVFKTNEAACKWASTYFQVASITNNDNTGT